MKKFIRFIVPLLLIITLIAAYANNPTIEAFSDWCIQEIMGDSPIGQTLGNLTSAVVSSSPLVRSLLQSFVTHKNFLFFSVFEFEDIKILGIFNNFFDISFPKA